jgi:hypothetical protein
MISASEKTLFLPCEGITKPSLPSEVDFDLAEKRLRLGAAIEHHADQHIVNGMGADGDSEAANLEKQGKIDAR